MRTGRAELRRSARVHTLLVTVVLTVAATFFAFRIQLLLPQVSATHSPIAELAIQRLPCARVLVYMPDVRLCSRVSIADRRCRRRAVGSQTRIEDDVMTDEVQRSGRGFDRHRTAEAARHHHRGEHVCRLTEQRVAATQLTSIAHRMRDQSILVVASSRQRRLGNFFGRVMSLLVPYSWVLTHVVCASSWSPLRSAPCFPGVMSFPALGVNLGSVSGTRRVTARVRTEAALDAPGDASRAEEARCRRPRRREGEARGR
jgi:hypothetical protein